MQTRRSDVPRAARERTDPGGVRRSPWTALGPLRVPRRRDPGLPQLRCLPCSVAEDFGISSSCLKRWVAIVDRKSANPSPAGSAANESEALREANKRIKLLEQENEVLRRAPAYLSQANLPGK